jgi:hypothetical protein
VNSHGIVACDGERICDLALPQGENDIAELTQFPGAIHLRSPYQGSAKKSRISVARLFADSRACFPFRPGATVEQRLWLVVVVANETGKRWLLPGLGFKSFEPVDDLIAEPLTAIGLARDFSIGTALAPVSIRGFDGWQQILEEYDIQFLVLDANYHSRTGLMSRVVQSSDWQQSFQGGC